MPDFLSACKVGKARALRNDAGICELWMRAHGPPGRSNLIAMIFEGGARDEAGSSSMLQALQQGALAALAGTPYPLVVQPLAGAGGTRSAALEQFLDYHRPEGVLLVPPLSELDALAALCRKHALPFARIGHGAVPRDRAYLRCDDRGGAAAAVDHLVALGHRRIAFIAGSEHDVAAAQRELGYLDAMTAHQLDRGPSLVVPGDGSMESGRSAAALLLELSPTPTAILAATDEMAAGAAQAAAGAQSAAGTQLRIGRELSLVGFGDGPVAASQAVPLTTMRVPYAEMAQEAVRRLIDPRFASAPPPPIFRPVLVERESTAPA